MSECNLNINLLNIHKKYTNYLIIINHNINKISIRRSNNTLNLGVEIYGVEENNKKEEEDLVEEEAKSYIITMDNHDTLLEILQFLWIHVHIVKHLIILSNNVDNWSQSGRLEQW